MGDGIADVSSGEPPHISLPSMRSALPRLSRTPRALQQAVLTRSLLRLCSVSAGVNGADLERVCIVGTGPAGFYCAKYLLKDHPTCKVDMLDMLPTPFGLIRSGVAPDHPEVKSVQNDFESVAENPRLGFLGNVGVGRDVSVADLQQHYNAVILAYGAASDRKLGVPGEGLSNVLPARAFVNWYNGHPDFVGLKPRLDVEDAVVVGHGNVALDCARILCKTPEELRSTDIASGALDALSKSSIKRVSVVGRRGHIQAAFSMKELREVTKLADANLIVLQSELAKGMTTGSLKELEGSRARKRMQDLLSEVAEKCTQLDPGKQKQLFIRFLLSPLAMLPSADDPSSVGSVLLGENELLGDDHDQHAVATGKEVTLPAGLVLVSIGYKSIRVPGVPFDESRHVVRNSGGRVVNDDGSQVPGLYCSGWLKRGPSGIIGSNIHDARETVALLLEDVAAHRVPHIATPGGLSALKELLIKDGKAADRLVDWEGYKRIDAAEVARGAVAGKPREKLINIEDMLAIAAGTKQQ